VVVVEVLLSSSFAIYATATNNCCNTRNSGRLCFSKANTTSGRLDHHDGQGYRRFGVGALQSVCTPFARQLSLDTSATPELPPKQRLELLLVRKPRLAVIKSAAANAV